MIDGRNPVLARPTTYSPTANHSGALHQRVSELFTKLEVVEYQQRNADVRATDVSDLSNASLVQE